jgi:ferrochelatase
MENVLSQEKITVVLLNLGGPNDLAAVRPFLFNLFKDPAIIRLPKIPRLLIAWLISTLRHKKAQSIYTRIGGKSPLLENTNAQAAALETLVIQKFPNAKVHVCMRYWHPFSDEVIKKILHDMPEHVVLLPLYPQYSTTTTMSSLKDMRDQLDKKSFYGKIHEVCCYFDAPDFIKAHVQHISAALKSTPEGLTPIVLFSAHGVPQDVIDDGDPYAWQVEKTVLKIMEKIPGVNYKICYQSKVGPKKWLEPSIDTVLRGCADDENAAVFVVPIAFVSDHSETLVELDMDYKDLSENLGIKFYHRVESLGTQSDYMTCLADIVTNTVLSKNVHVRKCPEKFSACPCRLLQK